ncbi:raffinose/stachyose/melibiose transport system permease protein [Anaerocolumna jejuensis DSM 15929]|uniref:Raffinose/stachyose/melibiose transport system permease protein n=1 Tax=Anaerocolumna jejuensis DSM 15929 TaxID=1121322 RepID=A0A1M6Q4S2_9FIRM|nr:carbohydrate ABC transporter permease [Anaerocolumna jejuensis]SHK15137.1 raffinose/stachyose/melibiose transport system permease protein [Anaerocolumna jejuensis DSM 15929]
MKKKKSISAVFVFLIVLLLAILFFMPFFLVIINSLKESQEFVANPFSWPVKVKWSNYANAFQTMNFSHAFLNSLIICVIATAFSAVLSAMNAYVLSRKKWKINRIIFMLLVAAMVIPFQVIMIPLVKIYGSWFGLTNNILLVTLLHIGLNIPFPTFLYCGFVGGIPEELDEAAVIDGASSERTFFNIIFPLLKPITITCVVFTALSIWNDYILASTFLSLKEVKTLPLMTYAFLTTHSADYSPMMAGLVLTMLPVLILYLVGQRYIIEGIVAGSVKG